MEDLRHPQEKLYDPKYKIPEYTPTFQEIAQQMRINADCIMKEITDHVDRELERFQNEMKTLSK